MGIFRVDIEIGDASGSVFERVNAIVDTGASYSVVPASVLERLGVQSHDQMEFILGDGSTVKKRLGRARIRVDGRSEVTLVVFGDEEAPCFLGAYALEGLRLGVDPLNRRLIPVPGYLA